VVEVVVGDGPGPWAAAGFAVEPGGAGTTVGAVRLTFAPPPDTSVEPEAGVRPDAGGGDRGIRRWALSPDPAPPTGELDGLPTGPASIGTDPGRPPDHPNGATVLDHLVVLSPDVDRTSDALAGAGLDLRRVRPIPGTDPRRVQVFFRGGEVIVELVGPEEPRGDGPARFYGLAFAVADLDATAALLGDRLSGIRPAVQPGRRIATLRHRELGLSVPVAFLSERAGYDAARVEATRT
jgi:hypothetical protein